MVIVVRKEQSVPVWSMRMRKGQRASAGEADLLVGCRVAFLFERTREYFYGATL